MLLQLQTYHYVVGGLGAELLGWKEGGDKVPHPAKRQAVCSTLPCQCMALKGSLAWQRVEQSGGQETAEGVACFPCQPIGWVCKCTIGGGGNL